MRIALFGGTFDPPHFGHLAAAKAAQSSFGLDQVHFVPAETPPHKRRKITPFAHRYAMVSLTCSGNPGFIPSLLESGSPGEPNYSIGTVQRMTAKLAPGDELFFLVGADAFLGIQTWKDPIALLDACDFIIVSRPGFAIEKITDVIPPESRSDESSPAGSVQEHIRLRRRCLYLLTSVHAEVSASDIRRRAARNDPLCGLVPDAVADYIRKTQLYADAQQTD